MTAASYTGHCPSCRLRQPVLPDGQIVDHRRQTGYPCAGGPVVPASVQCVVCRRLVDHGPHARGCRNKPLRVAG